MIMFVSATLIMLTRLGAFAIPGDTCGGDKTVTRFLADVSDIRKTPFVANDLTNAVFAAGQPGRHGATG